MTAVTATATAALMDAAAPETTDEYGIDFGYSFLAGVDPLRPPATVHVPRRDLEAMGNMERQYWEIKSRNYNVVIFFKKGKFYELYDYDAVIANREFGLKMVLDTTNRGKMRLAGVPEQSFGEWARLFVFRGYKVGRVEQLKDDPEEPGQGPAKAKAKVIARALVEVITPGTVTDPDMLAGHAEVYVLAAMPVVDTADTATGRRRRPFVDAFAVDLSRHVVLHCPCRSDASHSDGDGDKGWEDSLRSLSALLQQLRPTEVLLPAVAALPLHQQDAKAAAQRTDALRQWVAADGYGAEVLPLRAPLGSAADMMAQYFESLCLQRHLGLLAEPALYDRHLAQSLQSARAGAGEEAEAASNDGDDAVAALAAQRRADPGMTLDTNTVANLELVANLFDRTEAHTLGAYVNRCVTNGGRRLMRAWVLRPSASAAVVRARQAAVRYLVDHQLVQPWDALADPTAPAGTDVAESCASRKRPRSSFAARFAGLAGLDVERYLSRLADLRDGAAGGGAAVALVDPMAGYSRGLATVLAAARAFAEMLEWALQFRAQCATCGPAPPPPLLEALLRDIEAAADSVAHMESLFDRHSAAAAGLLVPAAGTAPEYDAAAAALAAVEAKLHAERAAAAAGVFGGAEVTFADLGKDLFLYEVPLRDAPARTPAGMTERARSGRTVKYSVDALQPLVEQHRAAAAAKSAALLRVLGAVAGRMCSRCAELHRASQALAHMDCLMSLAQVFMADRAHMCFPTILESDGGAVLRARDMLHPLLLRPPTSGGGGGAAAAVPNSVTLDAAAGRVLVLTGPNMAGKSTVMRTLAANVILAQLGGAVLAREMALTCVDRVFTRIGARDAGSRGQSTLYVELSETAELLRAATPRSLCLVDELGRGTSTHDGMAIAHAALRALARTAPLTLFSTHYHALALEIARAGRAGVQLGYMDFTLAPREGGGDGGGVPAITFLYQLVRGICDRSYGVEVALMAGVPAPLVEEAKLQSDRLAQQTALHEDVATLRHLLNTFNPIDIHS